MLRSLGIWKTILNTGCWFQMRSHLGGVSLTLIYCKRLSEKQGLRNLVPPPCLLKKLGQGGTQNRMEPSCCLCLPFLRRVLSTCSCISSLNLMFTSYLLLFRAGPATPLKEQGFFSLYLIWPPETSDIFTHTLLKNAFSSLGLCPVQVILLTFASLQAHPSSVPTLKCRPQGPNLSF